MYSLFFGKSFLLGTYYPNCPTSRTVILDSLLVLLYGDGEIANRHFHHIWQSVWLQSQFDWSSTTFLVLLVWSSRSPYSTYRSTMYNPCLIYARLSRVSPFLEPTCNTLSLICNVHNVGLWSEICLSSQFTGFIDQHSFPPFLGISRLQDHGLNSPILASLSPICWVNFFIMWGEWDNPNIIIPIMNTGWGFRGWGWDQVYTYLGLSPCPVSTIPGLSSLQYYNVNCYRLNTQLQT